MFDYLYLLFLVYIPWAYCYSLFSLMDHLNSPETGTSDSINSSGQRDGEVKCTGTEKCHRGIDKSGTVIIKEKRWVECDRLFK